jgi:hypothetical protein
VLSELPPQLCGLLAQFLGAVEELLGAGEDFLDPSRALLVVIRRAGVFLCHGRIEGTSAADQNRREPALLLAALLTSWHERVRRLAMLALYGGQQFCDQGGQLLGFDLESFQFPAQPFQPLDRSGGRGTTTWHRGSSHCEPVPSILQAGQRAFSRPGPLYSAELRGIQSGRHRTMTRILKTNTSLLSRAPGSWDTAQLQRCCGAREGGTGACPRADNPVPAFVPPSNRGGF